eukprot:7817805-Alexandrium_andersonii.AAC.1
MRLRLGPRRKQGTAWFRPRLASPPSLSTAQLSLRMVYRARSTAATAVLSWTTGVPASTLNARASSGRELSRAEVRAGNEAPSELPGQ